MKKALLILAAIVIVFLGVRFFYSGTQANEAAGSYDAIICFGDSLTYGTGAGPGMNYPSQLSKMISKPVINAGLPGDTTAGALQRLEQDVLLKSPELVLITLGGNDLKNGVSKKAAFKNLKAIVESIQSIGGRVIIGVFGTICAHIVEIWMFGAAFYFMVHYGDFGSLQGNFSGSLIDCVYFSFTNYTTVGYGDIAPLGALRFLAGVEGLTGLSLITWSASFMFMEMTKFWEED